MLTAPHQQQSNNLYSTIIYLYISFLSKSKCNNNLNNSRAHADADDNKLMQLHLSNHDLQNEYICLYHFISFKL